MAKKRNGVTNSNSFETTDRTSPMKPEDVERMDGGGNITERMKVGEDRIPDSADILTDHLVRFFGPEGVFVLHERESRTVHSDIYVIPANDDRPFSLLLTGGMSALPMNVPDDCECPRFIEVMMILPTDWDFDNPSDFSNPKNWPFRFLREMTKFPHEHNTWFGCGHTYSFDDDRELGSGVEFNAVLFQCSCGFPSEFTHIVDNDRVIEILTLIPIYNEELEYKMEHGASSLLEKFMEFHIGPMVRMGRPNTCIIRHQ